MNKNILDFGAVSDGVTLNTKAIQRALDECSVSGGGRVTVPAGIYKTGTIWLKSNVELHLEMGAELLASDDMDDYNELDAYEQNWGSVSEEWVGKHLIIAHEIDNCAITGFGTVNGNCQAFVYCGRERYTSSTYYGWCNGVSELKDKEKKRPGQLICFIESKNIRVCDITIKNSPCWSCYLLGCEFVQIRGIKVKNPIWMLNSDGIDIDASRYVTVSDCIIDTGDDAITLRASEQRLKNKDMHCEFVTVTNCVLSTGICAFRIGVGTGVIRHARISNIVIKHAEEIVQFCTAYSSKGCANIEDVNISNVSAVGTDRCFQAFIYNGAYLKNITLENIRSTSTMRNYVEKFEGTVDNFILRNVEIDFFDKWDEMPKSAYQTRGDRLIFFKGADNVTLDNVKISGSLEGVDTSFETVDCTELLKKDCNF